jgi:transposase InsO family protein
MEARFPINRLCQIMNVSTRDYRAYRTRPMSQSQRTDMVLLTHIRDQFTLNHYRYGRVRMTEELKELGLQIGHRLVGRLMRQNSILVVRASKHKVTTNSNHGFNIAPNILDRDFTAAQPNQKWPLGDVNIACQLTGR